MAESDLVRSIKDLLLILEQQGKIMWWERLNSGKILQIAGPNRYMIQLCRTGTPDFIVCTQWIDTAIVTEVSFLECKTQKGRLSLEQKQFQNTHGLVTHNGAWVSGWAKFHVIRDVEEVIKLYASN